MIYKALPDRYKFIKIQEKNLRTTQRNSFSSFSTDLNWIIAVNYHMSDSKQSEKNMITHQATHQLSCIFVLMKRLPYLLQSFCTVCML